MKEIKEKKIIQQENVEVKEENVEVKEENVEVKNANKKKYKVIIGCCCTIMLLGIFTFMKYSQHLNNTIVERANKEYNLTEFMRNDSGETVFAMDDDNNLYHYQEFINDDGNEDVEITLAIENAGKIKQIELELGEKTILTEDGVFWCYIQNVYMDNIKSFKYNGHDTYLVLTNDNELYSFGSNEDGEIGNGYSGSYNPGGKSLNVSESYFLMNNVKEYDINKDNDFKSVALTNNGELYVWGVDKLTLDFGIYMIRTPEKRLDNVESFKSNKDNLVAMTSSGEVILDVNEELNKELYSKAPESFRLRYGDIISRLGEPLSEVSTLPLDYDGFEIQYSGSKNEYTGKEKVVVLSNKSTNETVAYEYNQDGDSYKLARIGYKYGQKIAVASKNHPDSGIKYTIEYLDESGNKTTVKTVNDMYTQMKLLFKNGAPK